jgi:hypothetical protein
MAGRGPTVPTTEEEVDLGSVIIFVDVLKSMYGNAKFVKSNINEVALGNLPDGDELLYATVPLWFDQKFCLIEAKSILRI